MGDGLKLRMLQTVGWWGRGEEGLRAPEMLIALAGVVCLQRRPQKTATGLGVAEATRVGAAPQILANTTIEDNRRRGTSDVVGGLSSSIEVGSKFVDMHLS